METSGSFWGWLTTGMATVAIGLAVLFGHGNLLLAWTLFVIGAVCIGVALIRGLQGRFRKPAPESFGARPPESQHSDSALGPTQSTDPKNRGPVAIRIRDSSDIDLINNTSIGMPLLDAERVTRLRGTGNRTIMPRGNPSQSKSEDKTEPKLAASPPPAHPSQANLGGAQRPKKRRKQP